MSEDESGPQLEPLLQVHPKSIKFQAALDTEAKAEISLINLTNSKVAYKIKATAPNKFNVKNSIGCIEPRQTASCEIVMRRLTSVPDQTKNKFLVQSMSITELPADLVALWKEKETLHKTTRNEYCEDKIKCKMLVSASERAAFASERGTLEASRIESEKLQQSAASMQASAGAEFNGHSARSSPQPRAAASLQAPETALPPPQTPVLPLATMSLRDTHDAAVSDFAARLTRTPMPPQSTPMTSMTRNVSHESGHHSLEPQPAATAAVSAAAVASSSQELKDAENLIVNASIQKLALERERKSLESENASLKEKLAKLTNAVDAARSSYAEVTKRNASVEKELIELREQQSLRRRVAVPGEPPATPTDVSDAPMKVVKPAHAVELLQWQLGLLLLVFLLIGYFISFSQ